MFKYFLYMLILSLVFFNECTCKKHKKHHHHSHERHKHKHRPPYKHPFHIPTHPSSPLPSTTSNSINNFEPLHFLRRNNFDLAALSKKPEVVEALSSLSKEKDETKNMIKLYQKLYKLEVTGELNSETLAKMSSPSCANADIEFTSSRKKRSSDWLLSKWTKPNLTYKILKKDKTLKDYTNQAIRQAFDYWQQVTNFVFTEIKDLLKETDIEIDFTNSEHGDGFLFDEAGEELAHAFFPEDGRIHFFNKRLFTENSTDGYNLRIVATHEIGHALGLDHSFDPDSIMYKYYSGFIPYFTLPEKDIKRIQKLYDIEEPESTTTTSFIPCPTTTSPRTTTPITTTTASFTNEITINNTDIFNHVFSRLEILEDKYINLINRVNQLELTVKNSSQIIISDESNGFINKIIQGTIQSGYYRSGEKLSIKQKVQFGLTFKRIPTVFLETEIMDFVIHPFRIIQRTSNVDLSSFDVEITTWHTSKIHQFVIKWTAMGQV